MSEPAKAVFISYAREDLAAARRVADALSAFEVEVWFDQDGLEGGDAWDRKIRGQIKDCALFIAVISASTEARREAYFRLEWKLAEERTHLMAEGMSFLLPIAIDDTPEAVALVPDSFRRAQWMRLPRGVPNTQFVDRVRTLLETQERSPAASAGARGASRPDRPRKKWALVAAVVALGVAASIPFWSKRDAVPPAAGSAPAALADKSIAVLPFANMSDDKDTNAFFADGIHEDILTNLSGIREMRVVSRTSVMEYRGTTKKMRQIGGELGVAYILEGSVRRAGGKVRVTGQLINALTDEHVWAKNYDRDLSDIFAIQAELAREIASSLHAVLSPQEKDLLERRPTANLAAYDLFLEARKLPTRGLLVAEQIPARRKLLEQAVALDPDFFEAWVQLGEIDSRSYFSDRDRSPSALARAREAIGHATRLAPEDPLVLTAEGFYYLTCFRDYPRARAKLESVQKRWPNHALVFFHLADIATREGRWPEALELHLRACELDRRSPEFLEGLYDTLLYLRKYPEALEVARRILEIRPDDLFSSYRIAEITFRWNGDASGVEAWFTAVPASRRKERAFLVARSVWAWDRGDAAAFVRVYRELGEPVGARVQAGVALKLAGESAQARTLGEEELKAVDARIGQQPDNRLHWQVRAVALSILGQNTQLVAAADRAVELMPESLDAKYGSIHTIGRAWALAAAGGKDDALVEIARLFGKPSYLLNVHTMRRSLWWKDLQGDPRFEALLNDPKNNAPLF